MTKATANQADFHVGLLISLADWLFQRGIVPNVSVRNDSQLSA